MAKTARLKDRIRNRWSDVQNRAVAFEKRAKTSLEEVPEQLRGAWDKVVGQIRNALTFATREDLEKVLARLDDLEDKVDALAGKKVKAAKRARKS